MYVVTVMSWRDSPVSGREKYTAGKMAALLGIGLEYARTSQPSVYIHGSKNDVSDPERRGHIWPFEGGGGEQLL